MRGPHTTPCIVEQVDRGVRSLAPAFAELGVATVHESQGRGGLMDAAIKPLAVGARAAGPAVTCLNQPGDNLMLLAAMDLCQEGDVLVVANLAPSAMGMVGEIIASILIARGVAGLVVDAGVRDIRELRRLPLPVWSRTVSAAGTTKGGPGWVNVPVVAGGATVSPGDMVVADDDGVVVVPLDAAPAVLDRARARAQREAELLASIAAGNVPTLSPELRDQLVRLGVRRIPAS
ncbi:4-carboxy-4-hydroxy-2-oxoadipate aldolase/oxaloacetate decarboxylase [Streptomyces sp. NBC_01320]|uniref:4-carboxy-4-hydroxy-2-oxoadipate aldolase/oxaloacetate decarboxylase n=1 Tax=Streptomyces sp. NBC_01320 TaxID=2903824 RepID=UPI002E1042B7|nr:4-carboxy-4-hydroxy-2-oxoadipate aldolase/oxaloacetate decarboxylase [Streptomyces sp. NBC_01320]